MGSPRVPATFAVPDAAPARLLGELQRAGVQWEVLLETRPHPRAEPGRGPLQGRLHFVRGDAGERRATGWIFVAWGEQEMLGRFAEFSAVELWKLLDSLA
jgi:hypothetical protein